MKNRYTFTRWVSTIVLTLFGLMSNAQSGLPECTTPVPFFPIDLTSSPTATFTTPLFSRAPGCCGNTGPTDDYVSFYATLHPDVAMFELIVVEGADPSGSGIYNIISGDLLTPGSCGVNIPGGAPVCITGSGPHKITYAKPGNNKIRCNILCRRTGCQSNGFCNRR